MYVCSFAGMHVRMCVCMYVRVKNTDIHLPLVDRAASRRRYDASSRFERNRLQDSGNLQARQQPESAQARCPLASSKKAAEPSRNRSRRRPQSAEREALGSAKKDVVGRALIGEAG